MTTGRRLNLTLVGILIAAALAVVPGATPARAGGGHLLITEFAVSPTAGEFVEIYNPTGGAIDLTDVYLSDATFAGGGTFYYSLVTGAPGGGGFADFTARFPDGASIGTGEYQTIALAGSDGFNATYGSDPTYELFEDGAAADAIPDMREAVAGSVAGQGGLSDAGEVVVLFSWDGASDLVVDLDYVIWGDKAEGVDKSGVAVDGPDADSDTSTYLDDTPVAVQEFLGDPTDGTHDAGNTWQRSDLTEGAETDTGGNGVSGHDESSEDLTNTWGQTAPTPGAATTIEPPGGLPDPADHLLLTEIVVTPTAGEFVEIYNPTVSAIDLSDVYLSDATFAGGGTFYYSLVTGAPGGGGFADFTARFPDGASIGAGEYQTVAMNGSDGFAATFGSDPTYELFEDGAAADAIPDMREAVAGSVAGQGGLSDAGEVVVLFSWDGASDLVVDLDYVIWGDKAEGVDKSGVAVDGPDADSDTSTYLDDTPVAVQDFLGDASDGTHDVGNSWQRRDLSEGAEAKTGGNGATGNNETSEDLSVTWGQTAPNPGAATTLDPPDPGGGGGPGPLPAAGACGDPFTTIPAIQGADAESSMQDVGVVTEGVVTALLGDLGGFTIQDAVGDGDALTSDGIFVFAPSGDLATGDLARVVGHVDEFFGFTEITSLTDEAVIVINCGAGAAVSATAVSFPIPTGGDFEPLEGMLVGLPTMIVTDNFDLAQFGELQLSSPERLVQPTDIVLPGAQNAALTDINVRSSLVMDDGSSQQNPATIPFVGSNGTRRLGSMLEGAVGVMMCNFGCHKFVPTGPVVFTGGERPDGPPAVGGDIKVGTFNVLNYWTSLDDGTNPGARGADNAEEFDRQTQKLVSAISALGADVVALQELENNGPTAIGALVDALNEVASGTGSVPIWAAVTDPDYPGGLEATNAIKVGIIYRTDRVSPLGDSATSTAEAFALDRPPVAQTFVGEGEVFTVISNHFKSKSCTDTGPGEPFPDEADIGDGQACFAPRRTRQAAALVEFVAELQAASGDDDVLAVGDLNAYAQEDPVRAIRAGGLVDLSLGMSADERRSFVFFGQSGQLDYAFATPELAAKVTGADHWHINIDEPRYLDNNTENNPPAAFAGDEFRSSDHDLLLVGFGGEVAVSLAPRPALAAASNAIADEAPTGSTVDDARIAKAVIRLGRALDDRGWFNDERVVKSRVFNWTQGAVRKLNHVGAADVSDHISELARISREIAELAIADAERVDGDAAPLARAAARLASGDAALAAGHPAQAIGRYKQAWKNANKAMETPRFATFNASLNRNAAGQLAADVATSSNAQAKVIAEIVQRNRPEVLLINEFDYDADGFAAAGFANNYLAVSQGGADPIHYPYVYTAPSNTGIDSGMDLDNSGSVGGPNDAFGFGFFEGQFGMVIYSMHPIHEDAVRTFQNFLWKDMPGALLPVDPATGPWFTAEELEIVRLSSKSHWDVPVQIGRETVHFLTSHPTPPVFDGPEDRNGTRNFDEIRFWADYVDPAASAYVYDDEGGTGGLYSGAKFVIAGDQNSDPFDGDSIPGAAQQLLDSALVNTSITPSSLGGPEQAALQGGINDTHISDPAYDTADFSDSAPGNLRADYVLPSSTMEMQDAAIFWPLASDPLFALVGTFPFPSSDHKLVWVNIKVR